MPPSANSNRPRRCCNAPVKEPFSCPNNSEAIKSRGMAAQLTLTNAREERRDRLWIARAISSLPVPVSPVISTVASVGATLDTRDSTLLQGARTSDDLVAHRSLIDFFAQGDALVFESLFGLLWIRHDYRDAGHNLPHRSRNVARWLDLFILVSHGR